MSQKFDGFPTNSYLELDSNGHIATHEKFASGNTNHKLRKELNDNDYVNHTNVGSLLPKFSFETKCNQEFY